MINIDSSHEETSSVSKAIPPSKNPHCNSIQQVKHNIVSSQKNNLTSCYQENYSASANNELLDNKAKNSQSTLNLLVVEDDLTSQKVMKHMLADLGYTQITIVGTGHQAIDAISTSRFDMIIVDISLPDMDGFNISREIRKSAEHNNVAIIAITAFSRDEVETKCYSSGINDVITKPIFIDELKNVLDTWLDA